MEMGSSAQDQVFLGKAAGDQNIQRKEKYYYADAEIVLNFVCLEFDLERRGIHSEENSIQSEKNMEIRNGKSGDDSTILKGKSRETKADSTLEIVSPRISSNVNSEKLPVDHESENMDHTQREHDVYSSQDFLTSAQDQIYQLQKYNNELTERLRLAEEQKISMEEDYGRVLAKLSDCQIKLDKLMDALNMKEKETQILRASQQGSIFCLQLFYFKASFVCLCRSRTER